jgi:hypothetical protein
MAKYLFLLYDEESAWVEAPAEVRERLLAEHGAFGQKYGAKVLGGSALQPVDTATTVRPDAGGRTVTDGPFAESKETLGGYYLVEADDLDEAIEMARLVPTASPNGGVEVRPLLVFPG